MKAAGGAVLASDVGRAHGTVPARLASLDVVRGLVILVMIFVNDVAGVAGTPAWMKHIEPPNADGMTFVDVVFPAFLFIVGLAIPLALERRLARESRRRVLGHVAVRTLALLVLGVFMVNAGSAGRDGVLRPEVWTLLVYAGAGLVWLSLPSKDLSRLRLLRAAGVLLLLLMAILFESRAELGGWTELRPQWWGILGLIGWAYLVASGIYLAVRGRPALLALGAVVLYGVFLLDGLGWLPRVPLLSRWVAVGPVLGSHAALTLSGAFAGAAMLLPGARFSTPRARLRFAFLLALAMALLAELLHAGRDLHAVFIINKIAATPAWCLWSGAITLWLWAAVYWLLDVRAGRTASGRPAEHAAMGDVASGRSGFMVRLLEHSGQNALLAYLLAPVFHAVVSLSSAVLSLPNWYSALGGSFGMGLLRALAFAFFSCWAAAALRRRDITLRL